MRTATTAFLATLVVAALFWGNCFSCPQALLADAHRCCPKGTHEKSECRTQVLKQFEKADPQKVESPAPAIGEIAALAIPAVSAPDARPLEFAPAQHAPPDLLSLHLSFRI